MLAMALRLSSGLLTKLVEGRKLWWVMGLSSLTLGRLGIQPGFFLFPVPSISLYVCQPFSFFLPFWEWFSLASIWHFCSFSIREGRTLPPAQVEISWGRSMINLAFTLFPLLGSITVARVVRSRNWLSYNDMTVWDPVIGSALITWLLLGSVCVVEIKAVIFPKKEGASERSNRLLLFGGNDAEAETPVLWPPHAKSWLIGKDSDAGRDWEQEEKGTTKDEMVGWHHWLDGRESQWTPGVGDGQGGLAGCDSWGGKELTRLSNWTELNW